MFRAGVRVEGTKEAAALLDSAAERHSASPQPLWQKLAESWRVSFTERLLRGGDPPFAPLSETTIKLRGRDGSPLIVSGRLRASLETLSASGTQLDFGSRYGVARFHELGFMTGAGSMIPGRRVPARPWIFLDQRTLDASFAAIDEFVSGE